MVHDLGTSPRGGWYRFWAAYMAAQARNTGRPREAIDRRVVWFFREMCQRIGPTVCLELGAHGGTFSQWAKTTFPDARCIALEANPYVYGVHRERLGELGVEYYHLAAAATNGQVTLHIPTSVRGRPRNRDTIRMASLGFHRNADGYEAAAVEAVRVDDFVDLTEDDRLVAWIDVEGASDVVLSGGHDVLARADAVYIEVERVETWTGQWLDTDVAGFFRDLGKVPAIRDIQRGNQYNVVFLDDELAARAAVARRAARVLTPPPGPPPPDTPSATEQAPPTGG